MKTAMETRTTEDLKNRMTELYKKILQKRQLVGRYKHLVLQIEENCFNLTQEYETIDRTIFIREVGLTVITPARARKEIEKKRIVEKRIEELTKDETSDLLKQLLAIKESRQSR